MPPLFCLSLSEDEAAGLGGGGPRRDVLELARAMRARVLFRGPKRDRRGIRAKLAGPHVSQAWRAARAAEDATAFADGEHVGIPLAFFMAAMRRPGRLVMLGHYLDKPWKRALLRAASHVKHGGTVLVHSTAQRDVAAAVLHRSWTVELLPYQVDTAFWDPAKAVPSTPGGPQLVVAVGAEHRDYDTLLEAVAGLDCETVIAGGSHWARHSSAVSRAVPGVTFLAEPLPFTALRDLYARAALVVVPLHAVTNQSGVTTILEAMSMGLAVVVTATPGQREVVQGPLVTAASEDAAATADRGPAEFGFSRPAGEVTGLYVPPADAPALRAAIAALLRDSDRRGRIGAAGRRAAASCFGIEAFVERLAAVLSVPSEAQSSPSPQPATARTP